MNDNDKRKSLLLILYYVGHIKHNGWSGQVWLM